MSNTLRMSLAEWLGKMAECDVPAPGRVIAIYAAVFDITTNAELAQMTGIEGRSLDKWKQTLRANGWIIIPPCRGGRGNGIEVLAAYRDTPVTFTDVKAKKGSKYYPRNILQTPAEVAGVSDTETPAKNSKTPAEKTPVLSERGAKSAGVPTRAVEVNNNNIYNNINNLPTPTEIITTSASAREGETHAGSGVFVNCETIRHKDFSISLKGIELQLLGTVPIEEIKQIALGHALGWALDLEAGKPASNVVPSNTASFIRGSIQNQRNNSAVTDVRKTRAATKHAPRPDGKSFSELNDEVLAELERGRRK
jgi:hypothetical protein